MDVNAILAQGDFNAISLTDAINLIPQAPDDLGMFRERFPRTSSISIELKSLGQMILEVTFRGSDHEDVGTKRARQRVSLETLMIRHKDTVRPSEIDGIIRFGTAAELEDFASLLNEREMQMLTNIQQTRIWLKWQAMKGLIMSPRGAPLYDLNTVFGVQRKSFDLKLGDADSDLGQIFEEIWQYLSDNLEGETMNGVEMRLGKTLFERFSAHAKFREAFSDDLGKQLLRRNLKQTGVEFKNVMVKVQSKQISFVDSAGAYQTKKLLDDTEGFSYPVGTMETFSMYNGPDESIYGVNQPGRPWYVSPHELPHGEGVELLMKSYPLPLVKRPRLVVSITSSN